MPRGSNLQTDTTITNSDYLIGTDSSGSKSTKKFRVEDLREFFAYDNLDGYRTGRLLLANKEQFLEAPIKANFTESILSDGDSIDSDSAIIATSSSTLKVGEAIASVVFALDIAENDLLVIENLDSGERDFGVIESIDSDAETITFRDGFGLLNYTNFNTVSGFQNAVTTYKHSNLVIETDIMIQGDILDSLGQVVVGNSTIAADKINTFTELNNFNNQVVFNTSGGNDRVEFYSSGGDNRAAFDDGLQIGTDNDNDGGRYIFPVVTDLVDGVIMQYDAANSHMEFVTVGSIIPFGTAAETIATWAEGDNTGTIPASRLGLATDTTTGAVTSGTNTTIAADGSINASGATGTFNLQLDDAVLLTNATTLNFAGTAIASTSTDGTTATVTINTGSLTFGTASGEVATWAEGDAAENVVITKTNPAANLVSNEVFADGNEVGRLNFIGLNNADTPVEVNYGQLYFGISSEFNSSVNTTFEIKGLDDGVEEDFMSISAERGNLAIGPNAVVSTSFSSQISIGASATTSRTQSIAVGVAASASGLESISIGVAAISSSTSACAFGPRTTATGTQSTAVGDSADATASQATAIGFNSQATVANTVVLGTANESVYFPGGVDFKNASEALVNNDSFKELNFEGYSSELDSQEEFSKMTIRYLSDSDFEHSQFRLRLGQVNKTGTSIFSTFTPLIIDRYGITTTVGSTLGGNNTIGTQSSNTLTVRATATFNEPIGGSITQVVNQRDTTMSVKLWKGTQAQYDAIAAADIDDDTIYFTT